jgi:hypothetical protein
MKEVRDIVLRLAAVYGLIALGALLNGWALMLAWDWFVAPTFAVAELPLVPAIGIALVVGFLARSSPDRRADGRGFAVTLAEVVLRPAVVVLFGWILVQFA